MLVVDDHAAARESVIDVLRQAGYAVEGLASAVEALPLLERKAFDVVITDLQMPGIDGLEFIRQIVAAAAADAGDHDHGPRDDRFGGRGDAVRGVRLPGKAVRRRTAGAAGRPGDGAPAAVRAETRRRDAGKLAATADDDLGHGRRQRRDASSCGSGFARWRRRTKRC